MPPERRRAVAQAVRAGEAVADPRDADAAVQYAEALQRAGRGPLIRWYTKERTGTGRILHALHVPLIAAVAFVPAAIASHGIARWVFLFIAAYLGFFWLAVWPRLLRGFRNAPEAERRNRAIAESTHT